MPQSFQGKLPSLSVELGESLLQQSMRHISKNSVGGVVNEVYEVNEVAYFLDRVFKKGLT